MGGTPLGNRYALTALRDKRASLAGEIDALKKQVEWKVEQLAGLDATLTLFDPEYQEGDIAARKAYRRIHLFKQGELGRTVLSALRESGKPVPLATVVATVARMLGMGAEQKRIMGPRVRAALEYLEKRQRVAKAGERASALWALAGDRQPEIPYIARRALAAPKRK